MMAMSEWQALFDEMENGDLIREALDALEPVPEDDPNSLRDGFYYGMLAAFRHPEWAQAWLRRDADFQRRVDAAAPVDFGGLSDVEFVDRVVAAAPYTAEQRLPL